MAVSTSDEVQEEYLNLMGPELGPVFHALYNECAWLHVRWLQYAALFGTSPKRIELMNAAAPLFFRVIQDDLLGDTLLHLCRMTDWPGKSSERRLTIRALPVDEALAHDIQPLIDDAISKTKFARDWRNRKLAHTDLALAIDEGARPLADASRKDVAQALEAIAAVLNRLVRHFEKDTTIGFEHFLGHGDAEALMYVLSKGLEAEKQDRANATVDAPFSEGRPAGKG